MSQAPTPLKRGDELLRGQADGVAVRREAGDEHRAVVRLEDEPERSGQRGRDGVDAAVVEAFLVDPHVRTTVRLTTSTSAQLKCFRVLATVSARLS